MRTFLLFLIGVVLIGAYFLFEDANFRLAAVDKFPQLKPLMELSSNFGKDVPQVKTAKIEKNLLTGVWRSEDNDELLTIGQDGSFRAAVAVNYKTQITPEITHEATCTAVITGGWTTSLGQFLLVSPRVGNVKLSKMKFGSSDLTKSHDAWTGALINSKIKASAPKLIEDDFNKSLKEDKVGGYVTVLSAKHLTIKGKEGETRYLKVNPKTAKDPDGMNAPTYFSSGEGAKYEKLPH